MHLSCMILDQGSSGTFIQEQNQRSHQKTVCSEPEGLSFLKRSKKREEKNSPRRFGHQPGHLRVSPTPGKKKTLWCIFWRINFHQQQAGINGLKCLFFLHISFVFHPSGCLRLLAPFAVSQQAHPQGTRLHFSPKNHPWRRTRSIHPTLPSSMSLANDPGGFIRIRTPQIPFIIPIRLRKRCVLTWVGSDALALVHGHIVRLEIRIDGVVLKGSDHLLDGVVDEDEADEGGEAFLREAGDVFYNEAGVGGHQDKAL